jgi:hypothetical protein
MFVTSISSWLAAFAVITCAPKDSNVLAMDCCKALWNWSSITTNAPMVMPSRFSRGPSGAAGAAGAAGAPPAQPANNDTASTVDVKIPKILLFILIYKPLSVIEMLDFLKNHF